MMACTSNLNIIKQYIQNRLMRVLIFINKYIVVF